MPRLHERCRKERTDKIIFRVKPQLKDFVVEFASNMGLDLSDFMRMMLEYFYMSYFTEGESYMNLKAKFMKLSNGMKDENRNQGNSKT
jgi:hypothetical protein